MTDHLTEALRHAAEEEKEKLYEALCSLERRYGKEFSDEVGVVVSLGVFLEGMVVSMINFMELDRADADEMFARYVKIMTRLVRFACLSHGIKDEEQTMQIATFCQRYVGKAYDRFIDTTDSIINGQNRGTSSGRH